MSNVAAKTFGNASMAPAPGLGVLSAPRKRGRKATSILWLDRIVTAGIGGLVVFTPLAIGSVNPWAFSAAEVLIFLLTIVWMVRLAVEETPRAFPGLRALLTPAALFIGLLLLQLLPLPPTVERIVSPATYRLYAASLPGWPERDPYPQASGIRPDKGGSRQNSGAGLPANHISWSRHQSASRALAGGLGALSRWRPLSIAPNLSRTVALKFIAYACLFFLVLFYPLRSYPQSYGERRFYRRLLKVVLVTGLAVGCVGLLEQAFWNGRILWLYVPYDWGQPRLDMNDRAFGPFVNPDHFAAYLNLILPLALAGTWCQTLLSRSRWRPPESLRVMCFAAATVLTAAIALSLSRGGWMAALLAGSAVIWLALHLHMRTQGAGPRNWARITGVASVAVLVGLLALSALYTAPTAPAAVSARLTETLEEPDFNSRLTFWKDSLPLIRDFPLLGIGLGGFQDIFPRYQSPPWNPTSVREAHNDYLELAADAGIVGVAILAWFFVAAGLRIYRGFRTLPSEVLPVVGALLAGLAAAAFQEFFDFGLQIPGNAVLFTLLLAIAIRLGGAGGDDDAKNRYESGKIRRFAALTGVGAAVLIVFAMRQDKTPWPYLDARPRDAGAARALILEHPARSAPHLWYSALARGSADDQLRELRIAASLDPINPLILDWYAQALAGSGRMRSALAQLTRSVFVYPSMSDHFYLRPDMIPWLSMEERKAIDSGLRMAITHNFDGAVPAFAAFSDALHHDVAAADVLARASSAADEPARQAQFLLEAGAAYARADETARAAAAFKAAAEIEPANPRPYEYLTTQVFAPRKDLASAQTVVKRGLENGADPFPLYLSLAQTYEQAGDLDRAERALLDAADAARRRPGSVDYFDIARHVAQFEMRASHFDKAVFWMRKAADLRPGSADALYQLALAEEADYEYAQALRDLGKAQALASGNADIKHHYQDLVRTIAANLDRKHR
jgi:O-antigen ligase